MINETFVIIESNKSRLPEENLITVFDLIGTRGAHINLFSTTSVKRSLGGP